MPVLDAYTVSQAARRMGVTKNRVYQLINRSSLTVVQERPKKVDGGEVELLRAEALDKFDEVLDMSGEHQGDFNAWNAARARNAENLARTLAACDELVNDGVNLIQTAKQTLVSQLTAGLPEDRSDLAR
jgi:protein-tyrosine-phosphatase